MELRPYQVEAVDGVFSKFEEHRSTLLVLPTGCGKTICFAVVAEQFRPSGRVLVLAHREELITQAVDKITRATALRCGIERAESHVERLFMPDVTVATVQTLARKARRESFDPDAFGLVIVDEAHHAIADTYRGILDYFAAAKVLGVTATPDRSDGEAMGQVFESVAFVYEIRDAIEQGFLVPIRQRAIAVEGLDFSRVRSTAGDLNEGDLEAILMEEQHLHGVARPTIEQAGDRPTIVFSATVAHAHALAEVLCRYAGTGKARAIDGSARPEFRRDAIADFAAGRFQFLVNCALFTEGFDCPPVSCVAVARPTKSRALYAQMVGRGTRLSPETNKRDLLILDFKGNAGRHVLVTALDILDGNQDAQIRARAEEILRQNPEQTILGALDEAADQLADETRKRVLAQTHYSATEIDPFSLVQTFLGVRPRAGRWGGAPPKPADLEYVKKSGKGIDLADLDGGQVAEIAKALRKRYAQQRSSFNQARVLIRAKLDPDLSYRAASIAITALKANGWRPTDELRAAFELIARQRELTKSAAGITDPATLDALAAEIDVIDRRRAEAFRALTRFEQGASAA